MYKRMNIKVLALLSSIILAFGCIDQVEIDIGNDQRRIFIDGFIADSLAPYTINLSRSAVIGVGADYVYEPVSGAKVSVIDESGNKVDFLEEENGEYVQTMEGKNGVSYYLEIELDDGKLIRSRPQVLPQKVEIENATFLPTTRDYVSDFGGVFSEDVIQLNINSQLPENANPVFLRWTVEGEYEFREDYPTAITGQKWCYIKETVDNNNLILVDSREINSNRLENLDLLQTPLSHKFLFMYCFHVKQFSMTEEEYNYWKSISDIINRDGSLFDPPPGTVIGNLYNPDDPNDQILGYFSASSVNYKRFFTNAAQMDIFIRARCTRQSWRPQYDDCRNCLLIYNSTLQKPSYWIP